MTPGVALKLLTTALLLAGAGVASASYEVRYKVNGMQAAPQLPVSPAVPELPVPEPEIAGPFASCSDLKAKKPAATSGVHQITVRGNAFNVYCDMKTAGGGWTMVAAQYEHDPVRN